MLKYTRNWVRVWETAACMYAELGACLRSWVRVWGTVLGLPAELGACLGAGVLSQAPKLALAPAQIVCGGEKDTRPECG